MLKEERERKKEREGKRKERGILGLQKRCVNSGERLDIFQLGMHAIRQRRGNDEEKNRVFFFV